MENHQRNLQKYHNNKKKKKNKSVQSKILVNWIFFKLLIYYLQSVENGTCERELSEL